MILFYFSMAVLAGISIVVARIINANLANRIGLFQGTVFNYLTGVLFSLIFLLFSKEMLSLGNIDWKSIPIWAYLGGIVSVAVVVLSSYVTPKISVFYQTLFVFIGQLFVGIIVDFVALNQLSIGKVIGGILVLVGLTLNLVLDTKSLKKVG
ncbi:DMT family transporter [Vagococcus carniphilus]|uniref:DMT family transporter n=1 Tax=Vagococcus carniphilus TaxID=218144 RepID=UPI002890C555|nr:DMT family transporter [Vagococcus carniphilus]MDT2815205.1 DMT family transporter [Vagococcus carniphilus]MDT2866056.1 DMT family transporter [Vagococcus carniphilus]